MTTITKTELAWLLTCVSKECENSEVLMSIPGQHYAELHRLNFENMKALEEKLAAALESGAKRIAINH